MITGSVTVRYAEALFSLAKEKGVLDQVSRDVEFLASEVEQETVSRFLFDERIPFEEKDKRLAVLQQHLEPLTFNFVRLLSERRRLEVLRGLGRAFRKRLFDERGAVEGVVESARPLGDAEVNDLSAALGKLLGKQVELSVRLEPELIGGVRVLVDNRMLDQSLRGRLGHMRSQMMSARMQVPVAVEASESDSEAGS